MFVSVCLVAESTTASKQLQMCDPICLLIHVYTEPCISIPIIKDSLSKFT